MYTIYFPIFSSRYSTWIRLSEPVFPANETLKFELVSKQQLSATQIKYQVQVSGSLIFLLKYIISTNQHF